MPISLIKIKLVGMNGFLVQNEMFAHSHVFAFQS